MKWVKASDRLPKEHKRYYTKLESEDMELSWFYPDSDQWDNHPGEDVFEWLDESPEPQEELWEEAKEQRDLFCSVINREEWNTELRTACESLLIMYDNLTNTLTRKQNTP